MSDHGGRDGEGGGGGRGGGGGQGGAGGGGPEDPFKVSPFFYYLLL